MFSKLEKFMKEKRIATQYTCAVILIVSSIALAFIESLSVHSLDTSILIYIAQAFLLAASIFGLDYYVRKLTEYVKHNEKLQSRGTLSD